MVVPSAVGSSSAKVDLTEDTPRDSSGVDGFPLEREVSSTVVGINVIALVVSFGVQGASGDTSPTAPKIPEALAAMGFKAIGC